METRATNHPGEMSLERELAERERSPIELSARQRAIHILQSAGVPFLVGGAYAFSNYTGIYRDTKDLDLFLRHEDAERALAALEQDGWRSERNDETWLYKSYKGDFFVDLIFSSGNGVAEVDEVWFDHAEVGEAFGRKVFLVPPEEMIWSKAFVLERERYDGADVLHILRARGAGLDWHRMLRRFGHHWEVLLSHVTLFRFAYPCERRSVPDWVMVELLERSVETLKEGNWDTRVCRGSLLSKVNYCVDLRDWGYLDGRSWNERERREKENTSGRPELESASGGRR